MKNNKRQARLKRAIKFREKNKSSIVNRLCVYKTSRHIYAQIISSCGTKTLVQASTLNAKIKNSGNIDAAKKVGELIAKASIKLKIENIIFDRAGFKYHGRIKALADAARNAGLQF